jgi:DNA-binding GntR family transcriptional regulator
MARQPQYALIYESVKNQIQSGQFPKGSLLPSENELSTKFATTRMTVRQALSELVREGFIERRHGKGSIVTSERQSLGLLSFHGFSEVVGQANHTVQTHLLEPPSQTNWAPDFFFELTDTERSTGCLTLNRLRYADGVPVMLEHTFLPVSGIETLFERELLDGSLFKTLRIRFGIDIRNLEQTVRAVGADATQAGIFGCATGTPLLAIERRYVTNRADFFIYSKLYCHTEHFSISNIF